MKKLVTICFFIGSVIVGGSVFANTQAQAAPIAAAAKTNEKSLDQIVAVVNDDVVTTTELNQALAAAKIQIEQSHQPTPADDVLQKQVLNQLIDKNLQLQIAHQANIVIKPADVDKAIQTIAKQNNMQPSDIYQHLSEQGISAKDYRAEIHDQLVLHRLHEEELASKVIVSPQEVTDFMHSQAWRVNGAKEYHLEDILIPVSDAPTASELASAKNRALGVLAKINQGSDFNVVAQQDSSGKHALQGGDLGWRKLPEIPSAFIEQVALMKAKQVAGPIQTSNGFHIIRLDDMRAVSADEATPTRQQIEQYLFQRKMEDATQTWISKLRSQAFIKITL